MSVTEMRSTGIPGKNAPPGRNVRRPLPSPLLRSIRLSRQGWGYFAAFMLLCFFSLVPAIANAQVVDYWAPYVTKLATTSATINWHGAEDATGSVDYATAAYYEENKTFQATAVSTVPSAYQHVPISGLAPNTSYVYKVTPSDSPDQFTVRKFRTMPESGPFTFLVISDSHAQETRFQYVADFIAQHETEPLFILDGGDYASWDYTQFWSIYFQYADGMLAKFPLMNVIGNHEYHNHEHPNGPPTEAYHYHRTFDITQGDPLYHSFDCAGVRFVALDSPDRNVCNGDDPQTSLALAKSQVPWLEEQLNNNMLGTFTIHHHPIWSYGSKVANPHLQPWETLYHKYPISANFAGHVHNYQRYSVQGIPYFIVGTGGGVFNSIDPGKPRAKWYQYGETKQLGYLKVTVDPANNTATAQQIFIGYVETGDSTDVILYDLAVIADTVSFPLSSTLSTLTVTTSGLSSGTVKSSDGLINCGLTCSANYKKNAKVNLTPVPDKGSVFTGWTGACSGHGKCSLNMRPRDDQEVGAIFETGSCVYNLSPATKTVGYKGAEITVRVTAKNYGYCNAPEITDKAEWITSTATPFVDNKGSVVLTIPEYDAGRTGTLKIGGTTFTVNQKKKP